jgi:hypothetical protein
MFAQIIRLKENANIQKKRISGFFDSFTPSPTHRVQRPSPAIRGGEGDGV